MTFRWNWKPPRISSLSEFFDRLPQSFIEVPAFVALAAFCLFPVPTAARALYFKSFDIMVIDNMTILDYFVFPLVKWVAAFVYALTLGKLWRAKRSPIKELERHPAFLLFLFLLAWMSVGMAGVHGATSEEYYGVGVLHESLFLQMEYFLGFFALGVALRNVRWKRWLLRGVLIVSVFLVPCAFYLWNRITISPIFTDWRPSVCAVWSHWNYYGYCLSVFIGLSAAAMAGTESRKWRAFYAVALVANAVALCYNDTLGSWIGSLCACLFVVAAYRLRDGKWNRWALAAFGLYLLSMLAAGVTSGKLAPNVTSLFRDIGLVLTQPGSEAAQYAGTWRWLLWTRAAELIRQHPLFGLGFDGVVANDLMEFATNGRPHNEYLQYALFYGIPGAVLYVLGCAGVYARAWRRRAELDNVTLAALAAAFGYLCGACFGLTVYNTAPYLFIMLGLGYIL